MTDRTPREPSMSSPKPSGQDNQDRTPTREEMDADVSIQATFDEVMQAVTDGYGTRQSGHHSV